MSQLLYIVVALGIKETPADKVTGLIIIEADLGISKEQLTVKALINSRAQGNFISQAWAKQHLQKP
jgi:hypothetical protein